MPRSARRTLCLVFIAALIPGCGWTPRDEFLHRRAAALTARPGDQSRIVWIEEPETRRPVIAAARILP